MTSASSLRRCGCGCGCGGSGFAREGSITGVGRRAGEEEREDWRASGGVEGPDEDEADEDGGGGRGATFGGGDGGTEEVEARALESGGEAPAFLGTDLVAGGETDESEAALLSSNVFSPPRGGGGALRPNTLAILSGRQLGVESPASLLRDSASRYCCTYGPARPDESRRAGGRPWARREGESKMRNRLGTAGFFSSSKCPSGAGALSERYRLPRR